MKGEKRKTHKIRYRNPPPESHIVSCYYCPSCKAATDFQVAEEQKYFDRKNYTYYCHKCEKGFAIKEILYKRKTIGEKLLEKS